MFSANPKEVPDARLLTRLDYYEAQEIATTGAKVLHPRSIKPCRDTGVPMLILDTERPDVLGTRIDAEVEPVLGVKAISRRDGIVLVSMEGSACGSRWVFLLTYLHCSRNTDCRWTSSDRQKPMLLCP